MADGAEGQKRKVGSVRQPEADKGEESVASMNEGARILSRKVPRGGVFQYGDFASTGVSRKG